MKYLIFIALSFVSFGAHAGVVAISPVAVSAVGPTYQILYNLNGTQQIAIVTQSGGVTPAAAVVWDERTDGPLPQGAPVGYADRVVTAGVPSLVVDATMQAAYNAAQTTAQAAATQATSDAAAFAALKVKLQAGTATSADTSTALMYLLKKLGQ